MKEPEPKTKEIMIVDDQPENLTVLRKMLSEEGFVVRPAISGPLALKAVRETPPDLILLDIMMPEMDGFEVCRRLKEDEDLRDIPVIFVSALNETVDKLRGFALGAVDYVAKPFKSEEVLARVNVHLDLKAFRESHKALVREKEDLDILRQTVFQAVSETIVTVDRGLNIVYSNRASDNICPGGADFSEQLAAGRGPCSEALIKTVKAGRPLTELTVKCDCGPGDSGELVLNSLPLIDSNHRLYGAVLTIRNVTRLSELERGLSERKNLDGLTGKSAVMQKLYLLIEQIADADVNIFISGEKGTGKELVAEVAHYHSRRADRPLVKIECPAFSDGFIEGELFGHIKGAYSWADQDRAGVIEKAEGGSLYLEEVGSIPENVQLKLLRFLEQGEYERAGDSMARKADVRIMASSSADLPEMVEQGLFSEDLYRKLKGVHIKLPPLKERVEDIPLLCGRFLRSATLESGAGEAGFSEEAMSILVNYPWPGNIEELRQAVEQAATASPGSLIMPGGLPETLRDFAAGVTVLSDDSFVFAPKFDREILAATMAEENWNKAAAAKKLGVALSTLHRYLEKYGLKPE